MSALPVFLQIGRIEGLLTAAGVLPDRRDTAPPPSTPPPGRERSPDSSSAAGGLEDTLPPSRPSAQPWGGRTAAVG